MHCQVTVNGLDGTLASLARAEVAVRLRLGQVLEVLGRGACFELGFSSVAAYALERCDRSVRWVEAARCVARRVEALPALRWAMAWGRVSWSMGELLARVAQPPDAQRWLEQARGRTVREMKGLVDASSEAGVSDEEASDGEETCTLTCTVDQEEAWLFEATRALLEQLGQNGADAQVEALLAEAQSTLLAALPPGTLVLDGLEGVGAAQRRWLQQLDRWRAEAEARCESHFMGALSGVQASTARGAVAAAAQGLSALEHVSAHELDGMVRALSRQLAGHELELSRLALQFHRENGWRRLGYASEAQYACERLGMARSSLLAKRALALRLERLPAVAEALGTGLIGVEAALQVVRVATASTQGAWVERARHRTIKHLREEVAAALTAVRHSGEADCPPPLDEEMSAFHELGRAVVSGRVCQGPAPDRAEDARATRLEDQPPEGRHVWRVMLGSLARWLEGGVQLSAGGVGAKGSKGVTSAGRVVLRLRVSRSTYAWWRGLEAQARRWLAKGMSWLRFVCLSLWRAWRHMLGPDVAYGQVYIRDRYRCSSPVCNRRDVTPHHLQFRSAGGSDEDENVTSVCSWCHLFGVHGGRIRAVGTAEHIRWELGAGRPCVVVDGRHRLSQ